MNTHVSSTMIHDFIEDRMSLEEMEQFISHLDHCMECYDETQVYYMITVGLMRQDEDIGLDLEGSFSDYIKEKRNEIEKSNNIKDSKVLAFTSAVMAGLIILYYVVSLVGQRGSFYDRVEDFFDDTRSVIINELNGK